MSKQESTRRAQHTHLHSSQVAGQVTQRALARCGLFHLLILQPPERAHVGVPLPTRTVQLPALDAQLISARRQFCCSSCQLALIALQEGRERVNSYEKDTLRPSR